MVASTATGSLDISMVSGLGEHPAVRDQRRRIDEMKSTTGHMMIA
jgi:hypothetical protein